MTLEETIKEVCDASGKTEEEVRELIKKKQAAFENLITEEGALQIVASDLNVKLKRKPISFEPMKIKDIKQKMSGVNIICKVVRIFEPREFKTEKAEGVVGNIILADETGSIRVVLWNEQVTQVLEQIKEGDVLKIVNAYARENNRGEIELHFGTTTRIEIAEEAEDIKIDEVKSFSSIPTLPIRLVNNGFVRIRGSVLQKFEPTHYIADKETGRKVEEGAPNAINRTILNIIVDDGTGSIRLTLFGEKADEFLKQKDIIGTEFYFEGKATYNEQFDRVDFIANKWERVFSPPEETKETKTEEEIEEKPDEKKSDEERKVEEINIDEKNNDLTDID